MSATASEPDPGWLGRNRRLPSPRAIDVGFAIWVGILLVAMIRWLNYETIPYHVIFVSLAVVYGFRVWPRGVMNLVLLFLIVVTGAVLVHRYTNAYIEAEELSEIVLMPLILLTMGWHVRRRAAVQAELATLAAAERDRREREQEFLRDCSHALRTPLTLARGHVELLLESSDPAEQSEDAQIVLDELDRMNRLASRLLAIADVERPDALVTRVQDLGAMAVAVHTRWAASVDRDWQVQPPYEGVLVMGDAERLQAALDALLENAVRVTEPGQRITTVCQRVGARAWLGVEDGGPGFAEGEQSLAFGRFWRRPRGASEETTTGLGLSFVKAIAEAHAGGVYLRPGSGGSVGLWLPALEPALQRGPTVPRGALRDGAAALEVTGRT